MVEGDGASEAKEKDDEVGEAVRSDGTERTVGR